MCEQLLLPLGCGDHDSLLLAPIVDGGAYEGYHGGLIGEEGRHLSILYAPIGFYKLYRPVFDEMYHKGGSSLEGAVVCDTVPLVDQRY